MVSVLISQIGYRPEDPKLAVLRAEPDGGAPPDEVRVVDATDGSQVLTARVEPWGELWGARWWTADLRHLRAPGRYRVTAGDTSSNAFAVEPDILVHRTLLPCSADTLDARVGGKLGWQDCAFDGRGVESHALVVLGLIDVLDAFETTLPQADMARLRAHLRHGVDYLCACQRDDGSLMNEHYIARNRTVWHLVGLATVALARAAEPLADGTVLDAAKAGWRWCMDNADDPPPGVGDEIEDTRAIFGQYAPWTPPRGLRCRDELLLVYAATELYRATNDLRYREAAIVHASIVCERLQHVDHREFAHGLYGNFRAWDEEAPFQRMWEHAGWGYNCGAVLPDEVTGLLNLLELFPGAAEASAWRYALRQFAYGYLQPACALSPFGIAPLGQCEGEARFFGPSWHGFNGAYARMARTSMLLARHLHDPAFEVLAHRQLQWIAGCNAGVPLPDGSRHGISFITGIGERSVTALSRIPGSIANGFSASRQFTLPHLDDQTDGPLHVTTEDWILHNGAWLSALAEISRTARLNVKTMHRGRSVRANVQLEIDGRSRRLEANERGVAVATLSPLSGGVVRIRWQDAEIARPVHAIAGATTSVVVDFADAIELRLVRPRDGSVTVQVDNRGDESADVHVALQAIGVDLGNDELTLPVAAGATESRELPARAAGDRPAWLRAVAVSAWSHATAELGWCP